MFFTSYAIFPSLNALCKRPTANFALWNLLLVFTVFLASLSSENLSKVCKL